METNANIPNTNDGFFGRHKHTIMMVLGCMIPLVLLGILWLAGVSQNILSFGIILLYPLMHLLMMRNMNHESTDNHIHIDKNEET